MRKLGVVLVLLLGFAWRVIASDKLWVGGSSSNWFDGANWQRPGVPSSTDSIAITNVGNVVITGDVAIALLELRRVALVVSNVITVTNLSLSDGCDLTAWVTRPNPITNPAPNSGVIEIPSSGTLQIGVDSTIVSAFAMEGVRLRCHRSYKQP